MFLMQLPERNRVIRVRVIVGLGVNLSCLRERESSGRPDYEESLTSTDLIGTLNVLGCA